MPWVTRRKAEHDCKKPDLYHRRPGHTGIAGATPAADHGDIWGCRKCKSMWEVIEVDAMPPGHRKRTGVKYSTTLVWRKTLGTYG